MSFMQPEITREEYYAVETSEGTEIVPADVVGREDEENPGDLSRFADYVMGRKVYSAELRTGYLARLSAPGYLDATDWCDFGTMREAVESLLEVYGTHEGEREDWEADALEWLADPANADR